MTAGGDIPSTGASLAAVMGLTWKRLIRSRTIWVAIGIAMLPIGFAVVMKSIAAEPELLFDHVRAAEQLLMPLIAALLVASSIGDEIEDRTSTYLWSRPIARWVILLGKLATLIPVVIVLSVADWYVALNFATGKVPGPAVGASIAAGVAVMSLVAAGIATLAPRHGMGLTIAYLCIFDLGLSALPLSLRNISVSFQQRALIDAIEGTYQPSPAELLGGLTPPTALAAAIALAVIGAGWLVLAVWRFGRREA